MSTSWTGRRQGVLSVGRPGVLATTVWVASQVPLDALRTSNRRTAVVGSSAAAGEAIQVS